MTVVENTNFMVSGRACFLNCIYSDVKQSRLICSLIGLRDLLLDVLIDSVLDVVLDYKMYVLLVVACFSLDVRFMFAECLVDVSPLFFVLVFGLPQLIG